MSRRAPSVFSSSRLFISEVGGIAVDGAVLIRGELSHTTRLNSLENDGEYSEELMAQFNEVLLELEALPTKGRTLGQEMKFKILSKRIAKLEELV